VVFDSTTMRPLSGARVQLVALPVQSGPRLVGTDSAGQFQFDSLALGSYLLGFSHPRLDSLGLEPSLIRLDLRTPGTIVAPLGVPSPRSLVKSTCNVDLRRDSTGILRGYARSARDGFPIPRARLRLEWPEFVLRARKLQQVTRSIDAEANDEGRYLVCGVPLGTTILARARAGADSSGVLELEMPDNGLLRRDLLLGDASHAVDAFEQGIASSRAADTVPATDSSRPTADSLRPPVAAPTSADTGGPPRSATPLDAIEGAERRAAPRIRGFVRDGEGVAISGARVRLYGSLSEAVTGVDGAFTLGGVSSGTQMLEVRALGYKLGKMAVDVMGSGDAAADISLEAVEVITSSRMSTLDTLRVRTNSRLAAAALVVRRNFERRAQSGVGVFMSDSIIRARGPHLPSELFRGMPGITVMSGSGGQGVFMRTNATFRSMQAQYCLPTVFLDGAIAPRAPVDQMAIVTDIRAIEVYSRGESAPAEFQTSDGCGAIVIWTRTMWDASRNPPPPHRR